MRTLLTRAAASLGALFSCHRHSLAAEKSAEFGKGLIVRRRLDRGNREKELCSGRKLGELLLQSILRIKLILSDSRMKPGPRRSIIKEDGQWLVFPDLQKAIQLLLDTPHL